MAVKFSNNAVTTLSASISLGATSFTVASSSTFPTLNGSDWTYVTINSEVIKITAISGTTFTCKATTGAHTSSSSVELRMSAELLNDVALGDDESLDAIVNASTITGNAVDIFIYDTSKDSDGGAWRKRTQDTSWYNEASSTTRGSRKDFPAVAVIVAESNKVTIYDGDTPDLDMWMVFTSVGYGHMLGESGNSSVCMMNARIALGCNGYDLYIADLLTDGGWSHSTHAGITGLFYGNIQQRNTDGGSSDADSWVFGNSVVQNIIDRKVNDVAMTVLPNAPIDSTTGLPTPTIAVATDGGVSVIKDDGSVVENNSTASYGFVEFTSSDLLFGHTGYENINVTAISSIGSSFGSAQYYYGAPLAPLSNSHGSANQTTALSKYASGNNLGVSLLSKNPSSFVNSSVAYITSKYNTGYMTGDIIGAWNVDTDVTTLGTELVTNGI